MKCKHKNTIPYHLNPPSNFTNPDGKEMLEYRVFLLCFDCERRIVKEIEVELKIYKENGDPYEL